MFDSQSSGTLLRYVTRKTSPASKIETMSETTLETILLVEDEPAVRQLFAQALRGRRRTLKLLCISGYPGNLDAELAFDFLAKPFSRDDLLKKVREVLDK